MVRKIKAHQSRVKSEESENVDLVELWKIEVNRWTFFLLLVNANSLKSQSNSDCDMEWIEQAKNIHIHPPDDTLAVVVYVPSKRGAMFIHETEGGDYLDGVGAEDTECYVIIPWDNRWYYYTIGSIRLGYIRKKQS
jgi:hypothetical protein